MYFASGILSTGIAKNSIFLTSQVEKKYNYRQVSYYNETSIHVNQQTIINYLNLQNYGNQRKKQNERNYRGDYTG